MPGFVTVQQAARLAGITKPGVYYWIYSDKFRHIYRLGGPDPRFDFQADEESDKPFFFIQLQDLQRVIREEAQAKQRRSEGLTDQDKRLLGDWHRRIKSWANESGIEVPLTGPPGISLRKRYVEANPGDPRPILDGRDF